MKWRVRLAWTVLAVSCVAAALIILIGRFLDDGRTYGLTTSVQLSAGLCLGVALAAAHFIAWIK